MPVSARIRAAHAKKPINSVMMRRGSSVLDTTSAMEPHIVIERLLRINFRDGVTKGFNDLLGRYRRTDNDGAAQRKWRGIAAMRVQRE